VPDCPEFSVEPFSHSMPVTASIPIRNVSTTAAPTIAPRRPGWRGASTGAAAADDGSEEEFGPNEVMLLPPGHDAWTIGDQACTFVEFSRGNDYYSA
jgi:hypothetical protein